ncbi:MAG: LysR substrate-binding domain-containing protein [Terricaulis sp.]|nr:LysR substrate-binding domain-containing protein [Terricaulis sp.]
MRKKYPDLRPSFVDGFSAAQHERVVSGDLDLAILYSDRTLGPLPTTPLLTEDLMLVGPLAQRCALAPPPTCYAIGR